MSCFFEGLWKQVYKDPEKGCFLGKCAYENDTNSFKNIYEGFRFLIRVQAKILKL